MSRFHVIGLVGAVLLAGCPNTTTTTGGNGSSGSSSGTTGGNDAGQVRLDGGSPDASMGGGDGGVPHGYVVDNAQVRSCDVALQLGGGEIPDVMFGPAVRGQSIPKAPRVGISFAARTDASLVGESLFTLHFAGTSSTATVQKLQCYDAAGAPVSAAHLSLMP